MSRRVSIDLEHLRNSRRSSVASPLGSIHFPVGNFIANRVSVVAGEVEQEQASQKLEFDLGDPIHDNETRFGELRNKSGAIINSAPIQYFMTFLIVGNAILLGVMTLDSIRLNPTIFNALEWLDLSILIAFTIEFVMQLVYLGPVFISRTWLIFDMIVVMFSWIFMGTSIKVLRAFRIFRVFSLASKWSSMQQLFVAVGSVLPRMGTVAGLLLLLFYAVTVLVTSIYAGLYDEGYLDYDYFGRLDLSFITLFQMLTTDTWLVIVRQVMDAQYYSYILFFAWVSLTSIIILNLIVAIICESLLEIKEEKEEENNSSEAFRSKIELGSLLRQQEDISRAQADMELAINALMLRIK